MSDTVISVEHISKRYQLGLIGTGSFKDDLKVWAARVQGKPNPLSKVGETDYGNREGDILWALRDINFTVQRGETLGIIGRNGAGKSTLLKILSRVTTPTEGHVHVKGRIASLLEVGTGFHPELTGRENIYLNGAIMGMTQTEVAQKFDEIVDFSGVEKFIDTPVKRYSSGMYVRLAFAVAAHLEPEILIVDEVLAVGDAEFQKKCLGKMGDVANEGRTVLFVSHNTASVLKLCKQGFVLDKGKIIFSGDADHAVHAYLRFITSGDKPIIELTPSTYDHLPGTGIRLKVMDLNHYPKTQFHLNEAFLIEFQFQIFQRTKNVIAAIGLANFNNVPIITYWSLPQDLEPGNYKVDCFFDIPLSSTELQIIVGLSTEERSFYYVEGLGQIKITDISTTKQPFRASNTGILLGQQISHIEKA